MFKHLASNPDNSNGRLYNELDDDLRNPFERDRARVIHSNSFRKSSSFLYYFHLNFGSSSQTL